MIVVLESGAECFTEVFAEGIEKDSLSRKGMKMKAIKLASSLGFSHMNPVCCPIAGSPEQV
jgi:hypothetical protein